MHVETPSSTPLVRVLGGLSLHLRRTAGAGPPGQPQAARLPGPAPRRRGPPGGRRRALARRRGLPGGREPALGAVAAPAGRLPAGRAEQSWLGLREDVEVDLARLEAWATRVLADSPAPGDLGVDPGPIAELELLPGWYEDWVLDGPRAAATAPAARAGGAEPAAPPGGPSGGGRRGRARRGARRAAARERAAGPHRGPPGGRRLDRRAPPVRRLPQHPAPRDRGRAERGADRRRPGATRGARRPCRCGCRWPRSGPRPAGPPRPSWPARWSGAA